MLVSPVNYDRGLDSLFVRLNFMSLRNQIFSRTMPLKAGARVNTPPLEAIKNKIKYRYPAACGGELHYNFRIS